MPLVSDRYLDARRVDILESAKRLFVRKGFAEATMQDIATDAGVSAGSIYRYFASKEELIRAVTEECEQQYEALFSGAEALATLRIAATDGARLLAVQMGEEVDIDATWQMLLRLMDGITREVAQ